AGIEPAGGFQLCRRGLIGVDAVGLPRELVPFEAKPFEVILDDRGEGEGRALAVGVVEAQQELAVVLPREQPVVQRDVDVSDMKPPGRAWSEAYTDRHGAITDPLLPRRLEAVGDRIAPIAAEGAAGDLHARRRLAPLVFGEVQHAPDL